MLSEESLSSSGFLHTRHRILILKLSVFANFFSALLSLVTGDSHHFYFRPVSLFVEDFFSGGVILQTKVSNWGGFCGERKWRGGGKRCKALSSRPLAPH